MEESSENQNQTEQNEKAIIFINEIKIKMKGFEEYPTLQTESIKSWEWIFKIYKLKKKKLRKFWDNCIFQK